MSKKGKKKNFKSFFLSLIILFLILGFVVFLLTSDIFNLQHFEIEGNLKITEEEIEKESGLIKGKNIFLQSFLLAKRNVSKNPRIFKVEVKRKMPNIASVNISERRELYQISRPSGYFILDNQGFVLRKESVKQSLIDLKGIDGDLEINSRIKTENFEVLEEINKIYEMAVSLNFDTVITGIDAREIKTKDIILELDEEGKKAHIKMGTDIRITMLMIKEILKKEKGKKGEIIVPENNPIYFRETK